MATGDHCFKASLDLLGLVKIQPAAAATVSDWPTLLPSLYAAATLLARESQEAGTGHKLQLVAQ